MYWILLKVSLPIFILMRLHFVCTFDGWSMNIGICEVALLKLRDRFTDDYAERIKEIIGLLQNNDNVEVQQRACEYVVCLFFILRYYILMDDEFADAREVALDHMPVLDLDNIKVYFLKGV